MIRKVATIRGSRQLKMTSHAARGLMLSSCCVGMCGVFFLADHACHSCEETTRKCQSLMMMNQNSRWLPSSSCCSAQLEKDHSCSSWSQPSPTSILLSSSSSPPFHAHFAARAAPGDGQRAPFVSTPTCSYCYKVMYCRCLFDDQKLCK